MACASLLCVPVGGRHQVVCVVLNGLIRQGGGADDEGCNMTVTLSCIPEVEAVGCCLDDVREERVLWG